MAGFMEFLTGKPESFTQIPKFTPEQQGSMQQLLQQIMPQLMGNQFDFGPIEEQARAGFEGKTLPSIASRLTSMGQGARYSSGAQDMFGQAGSDLEKGLASMKQQYGMQQQGQLQNLLGMGLTPQFDTQYRQEGEGLLGSMAPGFGAGFGEQLGKSAIGNWQGGAPGQGGQLGQQGQQGGQGWMQMGGSALMKLLSMLTGGVL